MKKDELQKFSVHDLRAYARGVGVRAPTIKRKEELINEILKISRGDKKPYYTKVGRPTISKAPINSDDLMLQEKIRRLDNALKNFREEIIRIITE